MTSRHARARQVGAMRTTYHMIMTFPIGFAAGPLKIGCGKFGHDICHCLKSTAIHEYVQNVKAPLISIGSLLGGCVSGEGLCPARYTYVETSKLIFYTNSYNR